MADLVVGVGGGAVCEQRAGAVVRPASGQPLECLPADILVRIVGGERFENAAGAVGPPEPAKKRRRGFADVLVRIVGQPVDEQGLALLIPA